MKTNIFLFWLGEKNEGIFNFDKNKYNVIIGPSSDEHSFLMKNSKYYEVAFEMKQYAFCSDVWRAFKLKKSSGLYIDYSSIIGRDFDHFISRIKKYDVALFRGNKKWIENGVMWSGKENNPFFSRVFEIYTDKNISPLYSFIGPAWVSKFAYEELGFTFGWDSQVKGRNYLGTLLEIRNTSTIKKVSAGSWGNRKVVNYQDRMKLDRWGQWENKFRKGKESKLFSKKVDRVLQGNVIDIEMIRTNYFNGDKKYLKQLKSAYRQVKYRKSFDELIIWPKLARIFKK